MHKEKTIGRDMRKRQLCDKKSIGWTDVSTSQGMPKIGRRH